MDLYTSTYAAANSSTRGNIPIEFSVAPRSPRNAVTSSKVQDKVTLSPEGKNISRRYALFPNNADSSTEKNVKGVEQQELSQIQKLKRRDIEVRTHEQAHLSAAGSYAKGGASFTFQKGADGKSYAVGGEVGIDVTKESTPEATISKMRTIKRAALAPANPSSADRRIASQATVKESEARKELLVSQQEELLHEDSKENPLVKSRTDKGDTDFTIVSSLSSLTA